MLYRQKVTVWILKSDIFKQQRKWLLIYHFDEFLHSEVLLCNPSIAFLWPFHCLSMEGLSPFHVNILKSDTYCVSRNTTNLLE